MVPCTAALVLPSRRPRVSSSHDLLQYIHPPVLSINLRLRPVKPPSQAGMTLFSKRALIINIDSDLSINAAQSGKTKVSEQTALRAAKDTQY